MSFLRDASILKDIVLVRDPAFLRVPRAKLSSALEAMQTAADGSNKQLFLLAAMRLVAMAGNGHSRVIPNPAIEVFPHRVVFRDDVPAMIQDGGAVPILAINGYSPEQLIEKWADLLAGSKVRQRMLSGIMLVWPAALRAAGVSDGDVRYDLQNGQVVVCKAGELSAALPLYPVSDNGFIDPDADDYDIGQGMRAIWLGGHWHVRIASLFNLKETDISALVDILDDRPEGGLVIDLRGNTGGSYIKALPLIDWASSQWRGARCAVLVNGYTFSAAIVTAVLLRHRLGDRARLIGSDMGDDLAFYAEGGTETLPQSAALLRYSTAWHDWQTGRADETTPPEIAQDMVGIGTPGIERVSETRQMKVANAFAQGV